MKFVIFHGSYGSPEGNWFPQLKEGLENFDQEVIVPRFPVDDFDEVTKNGPGRPPKNQNLKNWLKAFEKVLKTFRRGEKLCFVGHSLGPLFILHVVEKYNLKLDSAIFVSPFFSLPNIMWQIDLVNKTFYKEYFDFEKLGKLIPLSYVLYSENDPYVDAKYPIEFAKKMHSSLIPVKKAGHMNIEVNLNEFPLVYELCKSRLDLPLYQRYLAHRRELFAVPYIKGKTEEIVYLNPKEDAIDEGTFHFRNLQKEGFCTLYTAAASFWNTKSVYMEEARKAAKRMKNLTRVFVIGKISDLRRPSLLEQIRLDIDAGIKTYLCMWDSIKGKVPEPDFGIWDNDYRCCVRFDLHKKASEIELSSRKKDIQAAGRWKREILKRATRIYNAEQDVEDFTKSHA